MEIAGTAASGADGQAAGEMGLGPGGEGGDLLMADVEPVQPAMAPQRVGEAVQAVADNAVDPPDTGAERVSTIWSATVLGISLSSR